MMISFAIQPGAFLETNRGMRLCRVQDSDSHAELRGPADGAGVPETLRQTGAQNGTAACTAVRAPPRNLQASRRVPFNTSAKLRGAHCLGGVNGGEQVLRSRYKSADLLIV
jgi:hypothetical protein